jgi:6-phosphofructo-2-kinase / fructose-2,6-biphosphatase 4
LAVRLEPIILELEREQNDLLIIAHESVLRVLYAYLMHCSTMDIPFLTFPRDEIIEIMPAAYQNEAKRIHIPGLDPKTFPTSPDIRETVGGSIPASGCASGQMSPIPAGLSSPLEPAVERPPEKVINTAKDMVADKVNDED